MLLSIYSDVHILKMFVNLQVFEKEDDIKKDDEKGYLGGNNIDDNNILLETPQHVCMYVYV